MKDARFGKPAVCKALKALPGHTMPLTPAPERPEPVPFDRLSEGFHEPPIGRHSIVAIIASHYAAEPRALFGDGLVPMPPEGVLDLRQLGPHPFLTGIASELELAVPAGTTDVREPKKRKRFRAPLPPSGTIAGRKAPEFNETGFLRVEMEGKRGEAFLESDEKLFGVVPVLEAHDGV